MLLTEEAYRKIDKELTKFPPEQKQSAVIAALTIAQDEQGWVSPEVIKDVAKYLAMPTVAVQEVASFFDMFNTKPVGKYKITVCTNLPCGLSGGETAAEYLKQKLGVDFGETTEDGLFTLEQGECMGACGAAPVLRVNNKRLSGYMTPERIDELLEELKA